MRKLDISLDASDSTDSFLTLSAPGGMSKCLGECATIARSCQLLITEESELDDILLFLWESANSKKPLEITSIKQFLCEKTGKKRCTKKIKPYKNEKGQARVDEVFKALTEKEIEMEGVMANMEAAGMGECQYPLCKYLYSSMCTMLFIYYNY